MPETPRSEIPVEASVENKESEDGFVFAEKTEAKDIPGRPNEDALLSMPNLGFFAVFDGIGGHHGGAEASKMALDYIKKMLSMEAFGMIQDSIDAEELLNKLLHGANLEILTEQNESDTYSKMGTTIAASFFWKDQNGKKNVSIGHVGDSRVYRYRNGQLEHLTLDDGIFQGSKKEGMELQKKFSDVEFASDKLLQIPINRYLFKNRNRLKQSLGSLEINPHLISFTTEPDDIFLLTTDGITDNLTSKKIVEIINVSSDQSEIINNLFSEAIKESQKTETLRSKKDDMSAILILASG